MCMTDALLEQIEDATFEPGDVSPADMSMFYTALTLYPEVNNLRVSCFSLDLIWI